MPCGWIWVSYNNSNIHFLISVVFCAFWWMLVPLWYFLKERKNAEIWKNDQYLIMFMCQKFMELSVWIYVWSQISHYYLQFVYSAQLLRASSMSDNEAGTWDIKMKIIPIINELETKALGRLRHIKNNYKT